MVARRVQERHAGMARVMGMKTEWKRDLLKG